MPRGCVNMRESEQTYSASVRPSSASKVGYQFFGSPELQCGDLKAERAGRSLNIAHFQHSGRIPDIGQDR